MNTRVMAEDYIKRARTNLRQAEDSCSIADFATSIRRAQESVELALKAVLRLLAIEYPLKHDVGDVLETLQRRKDLPSWFTSEIPNLVEISADLSRKRGPAMYGYEAEFKPASDLFTEEDSNKALEAAKKVFSICERLIRFAGERAGTISGRD